MLRSGDGDRKDTVGICVASKGADHRTRFSEVLVQSERLGKERFQRKSMKRCRRNPKNPFNLLRGNVILGPFLVV